MSHLLLTNLPNNVKQWPQFTKHHVPFNIIPKGTDSTVVNEGHNV